MLGVYGAAIVIFALILLMPVVILYKRRDAE